MGAAADMEAAAMAAEEGEDAKGHLSVVFDITFVRSCVRFRDGQFVSDSSGYDNEGRNVISTHNSFFIYS